MSRGNPSFRLLGTQASSRCKTTTKAPSKSSKCFPALLATIHSSPQRPKAIEVLSRSQTTSHKQWTISRIAQSHSFKAKPALHACPVSSGSRGSNCSTQTLIHSKAFFRKEDWGLLISHFQFMKASAFEDFCLFVSYVWQRSQNVICKFDGCQVKF